MAAVCPGVMGSVGSGENLHCQSVLMSQRGGEFPVCVGLSEQGIGLGLEGLHGIGTSGETGCARYFATSYPKHKIWQIMKGISAPKPRLYFAT
jgi:hypothetical protein